MNEVTDATKTHNTDDYLIAGVTTSQHERSPPNFAWPVPQSHLPQRKRGEGSQNIHTEYRDNFHEWGAEEAQVRPHFSLCSLTLPSILPHFTHQTCCHVLRPKDHNPIVSIGEDVATGEFWQSEYQGTVGAPPLKTISRSQSLRNEFTSDPKNFYWPTATVPAPVSSEGGDSSDLNHEVRSSASDNEEKKFSPSTSPGNQNQQTLVRKFPSCVEESSSSLSRPPP
jgi:hypothetical protein